MIPYPLVKNFPTLGRVIASACCLTGFAVYTFFRPYYDTNSWGIRLLCGVPFSNV